MYLRIHRGAKEIGGSCVELGSGTHRLVIDIGMPLVEPGGGKFDAKKHEGLDGPELVAQGVLPNISGFYRWQRRPPLVNGLLISHAHLDHYGFLPYVCPSIPVFLSRGAQKLIEISSIFTPLQVNIGNPITLEIGEPRECGPFTITAYLDDHSAFDSLAFVIEADGQTVIYTGDFRSHGRHGEKKLQYFLGNAPRQADALLMEGTKLGHGEQDTMTEKELEDEAVEIMQSSPGAVLVHVSGQNIDRLIGFYNAAKRAGRIFAVDVYIAHVLTSLRELYGEELPYPSKEKHPSLRVFFPQGIVKKLKGDGYTDLVYEYRPFKLKKEEVEADPSRVVMNARPSMMQDLRKFKDYGDALRDATFIYSMWVGYKSELSTQRLLHFARSKNMRLVDLHTSGHADAATLKRVVTELAPKRVIPIHTFHPERYAEFAPNVHPLEDGEMLEL